MKVLAAILILISLAESSQKKNFSMGIGYPYLSFKHRMMKEISIEGRFAYGKGIKVYSVRGYYNWLFRENFFCFGGAEFGYITFDREDFSGDGFLQMAFVGGEYFIKPCLSLIIDIGPALISLETVFLGAELAVQGLEWVLNIGINYWF